MRPHSWQEHLKKLYGKIEAKKTIFKTSSKWKQKKSKQRNESFSQPTKKREKKIEIFKKFATLVKGLDITSDNCKSTVVFYLFFANIETNLNVTLSRDTKGIAGPVFKAIENIRQPWITS